MADKQEKSKKKSPKNKPKKTVTGGLQPDKQETINLKSLARDERTWKITGFISLIFSLFLFISFISYFFTWKADQKYVLHGDIFNNDGNIQNLLGGIGAFISHFFIWRGFGVASLLICTFFFVAGVNLLFSHKVFSVQRNLKYVTLGLLVLSVSLAFIFSQSDFRFGGGVGNMICDWLVKLIGNIGTAALLLVMAAAYIIWQFNPAFNLPVKKEAVQDGEPLTVNNEQKTEMIPVPGQKTINDLYAENGSGEGKSYFLKKETEPGAASENKESLPELKLIEKDEPVTEEPQLIIKPEPLADSKIAEHKPGNLELDLKKEIPVKTIEEEVVPLAKKPASKQNPANENLELEIKAGDEGAEMKVVENLPPYEPTLDLRDYKYPTLNLLDTHGSEKIIHDANELENNKNQIISTLRNYDIEIQKITATVGPTVTLYEIVPAAGIRISKIKNLEDDIALSLAALGIRIIAPIPGKGTIGIEVPNVKKTLVSMKTLLASEKFQHNNYSLPIALGKKIDNENYIVDLTAMPHLLMAGATGQGKSVGINALLVSLLYKKHPSQVKFVMIDPKKVELNIFRHIEKHFLAKLPGEEEAIITDTKKVVHTLNALCIEMDTRYDLLKEAGARNIKEYNEKFISRKLNPQKGHQYLPFIVLVIDEFADLIMSAGKEIEMPIARLAQLSRAVGIHLIIATQRPSVNIITGTIKANFPCRIAFKVTSKIDSRTILDTGGADQLIGKGDMLISHHGEITRLQCAFVDTPEVERVVDFIAEQRGYPQAFLLPEYVDEKEMEGKDFDLSDRDPLFEDAARLIVQNQIGSTSLLQRRMKLGYNRAGRLMDQLEAAGVVGPNQGSKARDVLIKTESDLQFHLDNLV
jgi:S-DNA-T family DNA segregation ATPase FtsK/SpoIIIE